MKTKKKIQDLLCVFEIPDFLTPWVDRFFEDIEIDLILHLAENPLTSKEINRTFSPKSIPEPMEANIDLATRAYRRGIINLREDHRFEPANFHARFDKWALFEGWKEIPDEVRGQLIDWELADYEKRHADQISQLQESRPRDPSQIYPEYILLHEAEALLDRAKTIYLMPCNCRSMIQACSQSVFTCIRFENDRGLGWEISTSRAKEIVRLANKKGLMQSGEVRTNKDGDINGAICNCCKDCCFPHKLAKLRNAQRLWPLSRYIAQYLKERCIACGRCVKRCPFQAFTFEKRQKGSTSRSKKIHFDQDLCRGCGVCCTDCPEEAIEMKFIENEHSSVNEILQGLSKTAFQGNACTC